MEQEAFEPEQSSSHKKTWYGLLFAVIILLVLWLLWNYWDGSRSGQVADGGAGFTAEVPDVVGMTRLDAIALVQRLGFEADVVVDDASGGRPDTVVGQDPEAGTEAPGGTVVRLDVTPLGEQAAPDFSSEDTMPVVPELAGKSRSSALSTLDRVGYYPVITERHSDTFPPDKVMSQNPAAGTRLSVGSPVSIVVSLGRGPAILVTVPSTLGMTERDAQARLSQAGLVAKATYQPKADSVGRVYDQWPRAGERVERGEDVVILLGVAR